MSDDTTSPAHVVLPSSVIVAGAGTTRRLRLPHRSRHDRPRRPRLGPCRSTGSLPRSSVIVPRMGVLRLRWGRASKRVPQCEPLNMEDHLWH